MGDYKVLAMQGLRIDGRRPHELREIHCKMGTHTDSADGSVLFEQGNTKVLVTIHGPHDVTNFKSKVLHNKAYINVEFKPAPFCGIRRRKNSRSDKMAKELEIRLKQAFEAIVISDLYAKSKIDMFFTLLSSDGGVLSSCMNAGTLALIDGGIALHDYLCACSCGLINEEALVDVNNFESRLGSVELNFAVLRKSGLIVCDEISTERLHKDHRTKLHQLALKGCQEVCPILDAIVCKNYRQNKSF